MFRSLIISLFTLACLHKATAQDKRLDSILHTRQHDSLKVSALADLGAELAMKADADVLPVTDKGIAYAETKAGEANFRNWLSRFYVEKGVYYQFTGNYAQAKLWFEKSLALGERYKDDRVSTRSLANLGNIANYQGDFQLAADYGIKVLVLSEKEGDDNNIAGALGNLANTYIRLNLFKRAITLLQRAIPLAVKTADKRLEANLYNSMATAYGELKQAQPELNYTLKAYQLYKQLENPKGIGTTALNLGVVYERRKAYDKALPYLNECISASHAIGDNQNLAEAYQSLARIVQSKGKLKDAAVLRDSAIVNSELAGDRLLASTLYQEKADLLYRSGDAAKAYLYLERHRKLNDSLLNADINNKVAEMEVKYQTEKKTVENLRLQERNRLILFSAIAVIIFICFIFFLVYRYRSIHQRYLEQARLSKAMFESEQNERIRIARDLHDSVGQMLAVIRMRVAEGNNGAAAAELVDQTISEVRAISHNLLPEALNFGLVPALEDLASNSSISGVVSVSFAADDKLRQQDLSQEHQLSIYRIVQETLGNMLKHSRASAIKVSAVSDQASIILSVEDNGVGFETESISRSAGIGWKNIGARVRLLDGQFKVSSEKAGGTAVRITLPLNPK